MAVLFGVCLACYACRRRQPPEKAVTDWANFRINDISRYPEAVRSGCLESLRTWVDAVSKAGPQGGPDGRVYNLVRTDDLLQVHSDRRDACFAELASLLRYMAEKADNPESFVRGALAETGQEVSPRKLRTMVRAARECDLYRKHNTFVWTDDGKNDLGLQPPRQTYC